MSIYEKTYNLITGTGTTLPVSPVEQQENVRPPSIIFEPVLSGDKAKQPGVQDDVDLLILIYAVDLATADDQGLALRSALDYHCDESFSSVRFDRQTGVWREGYYILLQRYKLKMK